MQDLYGDINEEEITRSNEERKQRQREAIKKMLRLGMISKEEASEPYKKAGGTATLEEEEINEKKKKQQKGKKRARKVADRKKKKNSSGKKDACYHKVKSRYKVWPSAYASGALVKCRKVGAKNWGNSKKESIDFEHLDQIIDEEINKVFESKEMSDQDIKKIKEIIGQLEDSVKKHGSQADFLSSLIDEEIQKELNEKKRKLTKKPSSETSLRDWFGRKGAPGKKGGWVDCNTCRKDEKTGKKKCSPCGRSGDEKRSKYPSCRPTPSACGERGNWGKKSKSGKKG